MYMNKIQLLLGMFLKMVLAPLPLRLPPFLIIVIIMNAVHKLIYNLQKTQPLPVSVYFRKKIPLYESHVK